MEQTVSPDTNYAMQSGFEDAILFSILLFKKNVLQQSPARAIFWYLLHDSDKPCLYNGLKSLET